ncbi:aldose epimerase [Sphingomonas sp. Leaf412]|uniref:aldose 1-epimerase family protein n=1 Tax=Sphingomonas sp. Leaf412 TaxID=1736370 RepID=UPI0007011EF2|nr:aldose 1-epimerase family protein [Sphingomonas sp. Leaf412]KQT34927.1 aldose epimerase [Sphingomonas sp. Leaf412]
MITIRSAALTATIDPHGAELTSLTDATGRALMTDADPRWWGGHAPILFPVVGKPSGETIRVEGRDYPMKQHGFARRRDFAVTQASEDHAVFTLMDDAATRAAYPFAFRLTLTFRVTDATLSIVAEVHNPDVTRALPASFGFHPAFAWPLPYGEPRAAHRVTFAADESPDLRALAGDGTILDTPRASPLDGRVLRLADDLFADDALIWAPIRSQSVRYGAEAGPQLEIAFPDTPMLGIWTEPGAHFVCVEPWHGIADPHGYTGEFREKPGVFEVPPGGVKRIEMSVTLG